MNYLCPKSKICVNKTCMHKKEHKEEDECHKRSFNCPKCISVKKNKTIKNCKTCEAFKQKSITLDCINCNDKFSNWKKR
jgi:hypothetical protein